jgi:hypothetical protein
MGNTILTNVNVNPFGVWVDSANSLVYYSDPQHHRIYSVPKVAGTPTLFGGTGTGGYDSEGTAAASTRFNRPHGIFGYDNVLYVCDTINFAVRAITLTTGNNIVTTIGEFSSNLFSCCYLFY